MDYYPTFSHQKNASLPSLTVLTHPKTSPNTIHHHHHDANNKNVSNMTNTPRRLQSRSGSYDKSTKIRTRSGSMSSPESPEYIEIGPFPSPLVSTPPNNFSGFVKTMDQMHHHQHLHKLRYLQNVSVNTGGIGISPDRRSSLGSEISSNTAHCELIISKLRSSSVSSSVSTATPYSSTPTPEASIDNYNNGSILNSNLSANPNSNESINSSRIVSDYVPASISSSPTRNRDVYLSSSVAAKPAEVASANFKSINNNITTSKITSPSSEIPMLKNDPKNKININNLIIHDKSKTIKKNNKISSNVDDQLPLTRPRIVSTPIIKSKSSDKNQIHPKPKTEDNIIPKSTTTTPSPKPIVYEAMDLNMKKSYWRILKLLGRGTFSSVMLAKREFSLNLPSIDTVQEEEDNDENENDNDDEYDYDNDNDSITSTSTSASPSYTTSNKNHKISTKNDKDNLNPELTPPSEATSPTTPTSSIPTTTDQNLNIIVSNSIENSNDNSQLAAIKVINFSAGGGATQQQISIAINREISVLKSLNHPSISKLIGLNNNNHNIFDSDNKLENKSTILIFNYCIGGDLFNLSKNWRTRLTCGLIKRIFSELCDAVCYLHENNIVHRDIKLENVLINVEVSTLINLLNPQTFSKPLITLSDFGLSRHIESSKQLLTTRCGSPDYVPPELLLGQPYDGKQFDIWSLGVLLYAVMEGRLPFDPPPGSIDLKRGGRNRVAHRIAKCEWGWISFADEEEDDDDGEIKDKNDKNKKRNWNYDLWDGGKRVVEGCLRRRDKRLTIKEIKEMKWVKDGLQVRL